jgi:putative flippase GtrA
MYDIAAQLVCSVIVAFINFSLNRFWTFRNH